MHVSQPHIQEYVETGVAFILDVCVSKQAEKTLERLPMARSGTIIDWTRIDRVTSLDWKSVSDDELAAWARNTTAARHSHGLVFFNSDEPCLAAPFETAIREFDTFVWKAPGPRLLFGIDFSEGQVKTLSADIVEFDGQGTIHAILIE